MSRFIYDEEDVKGLKIIKPLDVIIERNNNHEYTTHDIVKILSDLATLKFEKRNLEKVFDQIAIPLLRQCKIVTPKNTFNIREFEIFFYDKEKRPDPYAESDKGRLTFGEWNFQYFTELETFLKSNDNGIEITFGNEEKGIYGSILLKTIENVSTRKLIVGHNNVVKELIENIGKENVKHYALGKGQFAFDKQQILRLEVSNANFSKSIFKTQRVGLEFKNEEKANQFYKAPYCYFNHDLNTIIKVRSGI